MLLRQYIVFVLCAVPFVLAFSHSVPQREAPVGIRLLSKQALHACSYAKETAWQLGLSDGSKRTFFGRWVPLHCTQTLCCVWQPSLEQTNLHGSHSCRAIRPASFTSAPSKLSRLSPGCIPSRPPARFESASTRVQARVPWPAPGSSGCLPSRAVLTAPDVLGCDAPDVFGCDEMTRIARPDPVPPVTPAWIRSIMPGDYCSLTLGAVQLERSSTNLR